MGVQRNTGTSERSTKHFEIMNFIDAIFSSNNLSERIQFISSITYV